MNRSFHGFFNFWRKKVAKFESDLMETNEDIAMQIQGILQTFAFVWLKGGREGVRAPHHTIVCKIPRLWGAISSLTDVFLQDLAILLMLIKVFFSAVSNDPHLNFITPWKGVPSLFFLPSTP